MSIDHLSLTFDPLLPTGLLIALAILALGALLLLGWLRPQGAALRAADTVLILAALTNPSLIEEERRYLPDIAVLAIDRSTSQTIAPRPDQLAEAAAELERRLRLEPNLELRLVEIVPDRTEGDEGTRAMAAIESALADLPAGRLAGVILLSDGQIHDLPEDPAKVGIAAPFHLVLTGRRDEGDRILSVPKLPGFALVGQPVSVTVRVDDLPAVGNSGQVVMKIARDGEALAPITVPIGKDFPIELTLDHAGDTLFELSVETGPAELTEINNRAFLVINGVRDRLRVLLVSGEPHPGERTWRNILKADPGVDLVHFTILRPPEKQDGTPISELSLIAFPIRELFEVKLDEFDLIIFDRYRRRGVLPRSYLENIAAYVEEGGALLDNAGPDYAGSFSLYDSPLGRIFPAEPTGEVLEQGFLPIISETGRRHPVTAGLEGGDLEPPSWGRWFRQVESVVHDGATVMTGIDGMPLLALRRVGEGRVAQLLSDEIWLWSRGFEGGGPQAELLRRVAHWLMKEPELEEEDLRATIVEGELTVTRRSLTPHPETVTVTLPDGSAQELALEDLGDGRAVARMAAPAIGLYRIDDLQRQAFAASGALNSKEFADPRASPEKLQPLLDLTGGGALWLADAGLPQIRRIVADRSAIGEDWLGLRRNEDFSVAGIKQIPLLPPWLSLILLLGLAVLAWRREGR